MGVNAPGSRLKSLQRGTITLASGVTSNTATIATVNAAKSEVRLLGFVCDVNVSGLPSGAPKIVLTNATTITADRGIGTGQVVISYEVTEWD